MNVLPSRFVTDIYQKLSVSEKFTFQRHILYSVIDGLITGFFSLNEFVYKKNFDPGNLKLSMLFQLSVLVLPFSIFFTNFFDKVQNKKKLLFRIGLITRAPLFLFVLFPVFVKWGVPLGLLQDIFLIIFLMFYFSTPFTFPLINQLLKANYGPDKMGKLYSYSWSVNMLTQLFTVLFFGWILDWSHNAYIYIYPALGLLALISIRLISRIPGEQVEKEFEKISLISSWKNTLEETASVLLGHKAFRDFQAALMIYGIAFLMNLSIVTLFLNDFLHVTYSEAAGYKSIALILSIITFPFFGSMLDRIDPRKYAGVCFVFAGIFYIFLIICYLFPFDFSISGIHIYIYLFIAYIFYGLFQSAMTILWGIGSSYFTVPSRAGNYQSIHCTLTGLRGVAAPFFGTTIYTFGTYFSSGAGYVTAFIASVILMGASYFLMYRSMLKYPDKMRIET